MFIDWLSISQEHAHDLPQVCDVFSLKVDAHTGEELSRSQPRFSHEGSHSTFLTIHVSGRKVTVEGNPSRYGRLDNLFGFQNLTQCISVYNAVLAQYGLPPFTPCTFRKLRDGESGSKFSDWVTDGARIHRVDLTTNYSVGAGNVDCYLRGVSSQRIGRNIGYLYPNGKTVAWTPSGGGKGGRLQYRKIYDKANELVYSQSSLLPRIKRIYGEDSNEFKYVSRIHSFCVERGIVRFEQELKSEFLQRENLCHWGLFNESKFLELHREFLDVDKKLKVSAMDFLTIAESLKIHDVVKSTQAANATASFYLQWLHGAPVAVKDRQFKEYASRLNKIGINIRNAPDLSKFSPVIIKEVREITKCADIVIPNWYRMPNHLQAAA